MMIKYPLSMMKKARDLFPDASALHSMMQMGDPKAMDFVFKHLGFHVDEDDIVRAFRNKNEQKLLNMAKRARDIRTMYQQMFAMIEKCNTHKAELMDIGDCM